MKFRTNKGLRSLYIIAIFFGLLYSIQVMSQTNPCDLCVVTKNKSGEVEFSCRSDPEGECSKQAGGRTLTCEGAQGCDPGGAGGL